MDYCRAFLEGQPKEFFQSYRDMLMEYQEKLQREMCIRDSRILDLKIKVCHIIIDEFWRPSGFFDQIGIDAPDDFVLVGSNTIQGIVNIVRIEPFIKNGFVIIAVLSYRGRFGSRIKESAKDKKFGKAIDIVFQFGKSLIGRKERIQPQFF